MVAKGIEIGAGWTRKGETSNKEYVILFIAAPKFRPKIFYSNFGNAHGSNDNDLYALIWNRLDQTKAPAHVLHGGNHL